MTASKSIELTSLFGAFAFLQFTVLGLANHAGEGYLSTGKRELVYYALQVFVILGFLLCGFFAHLCIVNRKGSKIKNRITYLVFGLFFVCMILMLSAGCDSLLYVVVSMAAALCLGGIGDMVHVRMSLETVTGTGVAWSMGIGSAAAVILQYLLQIRWGITWLLPVFMVAACLFVFIYSLRFSPVADTERDGNPEKTPTDRLVYSILIAAVFLLFAAFYNEYIHHLQIQSDYASNVYSWPRLMLVPGYLLFAVIGDRKNGKYVPITSLCIMLIMLLNVVLTGSPGAYWLNMCLFYCAIAAFTSYYLLTFWRLAPGTKHPTIWAPFGRIIDSGMVLFGGIIHLSALPASVVLGVDIVGTVAIIMMMAMNGDFNLTSSTLTEPQAQPEKAPMPLSQEETLERMQESYSLTPRETEILQKLLLTEDELQPIADSLYISRRVLSRHISSIYQKTGTKSRVGLYQLYHAMSQGN